MSESTTYPSADHSQDRSQYGGITMPDIDKVLWHTTESAGWPAYPTFAPQLTIDPVKKLVRQHMPLTKSASTLANAGSFRTNRDNVVQIELVGYCDPKQKKSSYYVPNWGDSEYRFLAQVAAWFFTEWNVPLTSTVSWVSYPDSYGLNASQRLSVTAFDTYKGHLGHQHTPGNDHGDPGNLNMGKLLSSARELTRKEEVMGFDKDKSPLHQDDVPSPDKSKSNPFWNASSYLRETFLMVRECRDLLRQLVAAKKK